MFCNKCGEKVNINQLYCNKCGNKLMNNVNGNFVKNNSKKLKNDLITKLIIFVIVLLILFFIVLFVVLNNKNKYYFNKEISNNNQNPSNSTQQTTSNNSTPKTYKTDIINDNTYSNITINSLEDAKDLIRKDSIEQKKSDYPQEIIDIENEIINKYSITAVNLKEMDVEFARELENVIQNIYTNYPNAKKYLTNLTLTNLGISMSNSIIALFMPSFLFGTSDTITTRPWVIKTQIQMNAKFFLNPDRLTDNVESASNSGHFPKNATKYSPVAHEFGHYLSFIALLNYQSYDSITVINDEDLQKFYNIIETFSNGSFSKQMIEEAYKNYINDGGNSIDFDEWRGQISNYALAKDESGEYIYDETIAEAFHDVYLNGEDANTVSKYVVEVLKKYLEG